VKLIRIDRQRTRRERPWREVLPLDPRDPDVVRPKRSPAPPTGCRRCPASDRRYGLRRGRQDLPPNGAGSWAPRGVCATTGLRRSHDAAFGARDSIGVKLTASQHRPGESRPTRRPVLWRALWRGARTIRDFHREQVHYWRPRSA
jgi:hypothetical protein